MTQNILAQAFKSLFVDIVGEILYFPIWWYGPGLKRMVIHVFNSIKNTNKNLALGVMFKNLFKPMFGQRDRQGLIISIFMRLILTFFRLIAFVLLAALYLCMIIFWLLLPLVVIWGLMNNFSSLWRQ